MSPVNSTGFNPQSASDILSKPQSPVEWLWDKYIAEGNLFVFAAYMKVGKSTFSYPLALAIARGDDFLGYSTKKGGVLILALEEHPSDVERRLRKLGMNPSDPIHIHKGPLANTALNLDDIADFIQREKIKLLLIDSLSNFWNITNENDNAQINSQLKPLLALARNYGVAIGMIHHESKYGGRDDSGHSAGDGKSIRGGGAIFANVDQALILDHGHGGAKNRRVLKAIGRYAESPRELIIELVGNTELSDPNRYEYRVLGTPQELARTTNKENVFQALKDQPQEVPTLAVKTSLKDKATREAAEELVKEGKAVREGKGVKGDAHRYRLSALTNPAASESSEDSILGSAKPPLGNETNSSDQGLSIDDLLKIPADHEAIRIAEIDMSKKWRGRFRRN